MWWRLMAVISEINLSVNVGINVVGDEENAFRGVSESERIANGVMN